MQSHKQHTMQTYTKRVDHEAGSHRPPQAMAEPAVCKMCGDVYAERRWSLPNALGERADRSPSRPATEVICPACQRQQNKIASGYVHISGAFLVTHGEELIRLLRNEEARTAEDNPLARIMEMNQEAVDQLTVTTTTEHLAQRLGHALGKAYDGEVRYDFSHENKLAHVYWRRD